MTRGFTQSRFPCPSECRYVLKKSGKALLNYYERMGRRYALLPDRSGRAAAVINRYGKGTCIFIPSAIGSQYLDYCFPETRILLENSVLQFAPPAVRVLSHKNFVEVSARKNEDGKILIHLINLTGRARPVENIIPLERVAISLEGLAGKPSAGCLMTGRRIKGVKSGKSVVYTLPVLGIYDVLVI